MTAFYRYPHTPHLAWLGTGKPRGDKVLSLHEQRDLLSRAVTVEEKVDGANVGLSVDERGALHAQNRGTYLAPEHLQGQFKSLPRWLRSREVALVDALFPDLILFGEWCFAVHSVRYTNLPDWFLAFDVYDRATGAFWSVGRRDELVRRLGLSLVPRLGEGVYDLAKLRSLLGRSRVGDRPSEGLYMRYGEGDHLAARAKLVRPEFVQLIDEHWSKRSIETNSLAADAEGVRRWH